MKVLIVGAGMAGLALANTLDKNKFQITLIDKAPEFKTIGFAVSIWSKGVSILEQLNIYHKILDKIKIINNDVLFDKNSNYITSVDFNYLKLSYPMMVIARADLHQALSKDIKDKLDLRMDTFIKNINNTDSGCYVSFSGLNQKEEFFDLVVGADGIKSSIRNSIFKDEALIKMPYKIWSFWINKSNDNVLTMLDKGILSIEYPAGDNGVITAVAPISIAGNTKHDRIKNAFINFPDMIKSKIENIKENEIFEDGMYYVNLKSFLNKRVILIGDAAHAFSPILGMGTTLAIEDGYNLGEKMNSIIDSKHIEAILSEYNNNRVNYINDFRRIVLITEKIYLANNIFIKTFRDMYVKIFGIHLFEIFMSKYLK